jgi:cytochrome b
MHSEPRVPVKVWDVPIRVVHWAFVVLLVVQVITGKLGESWMAWHVYSGYTAMVLVFFRIAWGFVGSTHARFASFLKGPGAAMRFARRLFSREAVPQVGHNPLGGWMVVALLASLLLQVGTGLFAHDGAATEGPLARYVSFELSGTITELHRLNLKALLVLSAVHVAAALFHWLVKREDLIRAMFTGVKHVPESAVHERRDGARTKPPRRIASREPLLAYTASASRAVLVLAAAVALAYVIVRLPQ